MLRIHSILSCGLIVAASALAGPRRVTAQTASANPAHCDSVVSTARADSVSAGLFVSVQRLDGALDGARAAAIASQIGSMFVAPKPFPLTVFSGPVVMRVLSVFNADTAGTLRAPSVIGVYRFATAASGALRGVTTVRASLMPGFDSAAASAVGAAATLPGGLFASSSADSMVADLRIASDSLPGALRLVKTYFPRMPVVDAKPHRGNPAPAFPDDERRDSVETGEVMLRFVVSQSGTPLLSTVEVMRATSESFYRAAVVALPNQAFDPATIHGCPVAQAVDYPFTFVLPDTVGTIRGRFRH
ncbi:MAG TPA: energy transducer TonB [Gemmatimonadaceae bacterium]|jgi:TonB family protein